MFVTCLKNFNMKPETPQCKKNLTCLPLPNWALSWLQTITVGQLLGGWGCHTGFCPVPPYQMPCKFGLCAMIPHMQKQNELDRSLQNMTRKSLCKSISKAWHICHSWQRLPCQLQMTVQGQQSSLHVQALSCFCSQSYSIVPETAHQTPLRFSNLLTTPGVPKRAQPISLVEQSSCPQAGETLSQGHLQLIYKAKGWEIVFHPLVCIFPHNCWHP